MQKIYVDANEKTVIEQLEKKDVDYEATGNQHEIGDLRCGDTVIERKEVNDFIKSTGPHLKNQYQDMLQYPNPILIVSGYLDSEHLDWRNLKKMPQAYGMLARLIRQGITVLFVKDDVMLTTLALSIFEKSYKHPEPDRIVKRDANPVYGILKSAAPRIQKKSIDGLLDRFGTPLDIAQASVDELMEVDGVGHTIAEKIYNNFRSNKCDK